jgi:hypothetical protein
VHLSPIRTTNAGQGFQGLWRPTRRQMGPRITVGRLSPDERRTRSRVPTCRSDTMREVASLTMDLPAVNR